MHGGGFTVNVEQTLAKWKRNYIIFASSWFVIAAAVLTFTNVTGNHFLTPLNEGLLFFIIFAVGTTVYRGKKKDLYDDHNDKSNGSGVPNA